jgi:hypothetical protein
MNIRKHILIAINDGLNAQRTVWDGVPGVRFFGPDEPIEGTFIPFEWLGYNTEYGYFDMRQLTGVKSDCTNDNWETIHPLTEIDPAALELPEDRQMLVWAQAESGITVMLGEKWQVADLYQAIRAYFEHGTIGEPLDEEEVGGGIEWLQAGDAAYVAHKTNPERFPSPDDAQLQNSIRVAGSNDRIRTRIGASGRTYYQLESVEDWARKDERRGRPRNVEAPVQPQPAADPKANRIKVKPGQHQVGDVLEGRTITGFGKVWSEATLSGGQLWQECERNDCERDPVCVHCFRCDRHCYCERVEYCYAYFS